MRSTKTKASSFTSQNSTSKPWAAYPGVSFFLSVLPVLRSLTWSAMAADTPRSACQRPLLLRKAERERSERVAATLKGPAQGQPVSPLPLRLPLLQKQAGNLPST